MLSAAGETSSSTSNIVKGVDEQVPSDLIPTMSSPSTTTILPQDDDADKTRQRDGEDTPLVEVSDSEQHQHFSRNNVAKLPSADAAPAPGGSTTSRPRDLERGDATPEDDDPYAYPVRMPLSTNVLSRSCPAPPCYKRKIGRLYVCLDSPQSKPLIVLGPCWPMLLLTVTLIAGGSAAVLGGLGRFSLPLMITGGILCLFVILALAATACRNPGIVERSKVPREDGELFDERAKSFRPHDCRYDQETQVLAYDIDHFCPWTGTLIARNNLTAFKIFTSSLCCLILFMMFVAVWGIVDMTHVEKQTG